MSDSSHLSSSSDPYRLNRDVAATVRLNLQHYIWKESMGYILHPSIRLPNTKVSIADIATGSGIWLHDLSRQLPDAQLDGFDISSEQYPAPGFLPSNVSLRHLNIFHDIPLEYVGKYDVVHARLLVQIINQAGGDPRPVLHNLIKLVKPGGYLQWDEPNNDLNTRELIKSDPSVSSDNSAKLLMKLTPYLQSKFPWTASLAEKFAEAGLINIQKDYVPPTGYALVLDQMNYMGLYHELISKLPAELKEELNVLLDKVVMETKNGLALQAPRLTFVGQKMSPNLHFG